MPKFKTPRRNHTESFMSHVDSPTMFSPSPSSPSRKIFIDENLPRTPPQVKALQTPGRVLSPLHGNVEVDINLRPSYQVIPQQKQQIQELTKDKTKLSQEVESLQKKLAEMSKQLAVYETNNKENHSEKPSSAFSWSSLAGSNPASAATENMVQTETKAAAAMATPSSVPTPSMVPVAAPARPPPPPPMLPPAPQAQAVPIPRPPAMAPPLPPMLPPALPPALPLPNNNGSAQAPKAPALPLPPPPGMPMPPPAMPGAGPLTTAAAAPAPKKPSVPLKQLFWKKIAQGKVSNSIWDDSPSLSFSASADATQECPTIDFDRCEIESRFASKPAVEVIVAATNGDEKKNSKIQLLDHKKAVNIGITTARLQIAPTEIRRILLSMDEDLLRADRVELLQKLLPTAMEEAETLKAFDGDMQKLALPEQYLLQLAIFPNLESRLAALVTKHKFELQICELEQGFGYVSAAARESKESSSLKVILKTVLKLGNILNDSSFRGNARGFRIDCLGMLGNVRANDGKGTMLSYLLSCIHKQDANVLTQLKTQLAHVEDAKKVPIPSLSEELQQLDRAVKRIDEYLNETFDDEDQFKKVMQPFCKEAQARVQSVRQLFMDMQLKFLSLLGYLGEDADAFTSQELFGILDRFNEQVDQYLRDFEKEKEKEKAKAISQAQQQQKQQQQQQQQTPLKLTHVYNGLKTCDMLETVRNSPLYQQHHPDSPDGFDDDSTSSQRTAAGSPVGLSHRTKRPVKFSPLNKLPLKRGTPSKLGLEKAATVPSFSASKLRKTTPFGDKSDGQATSTDVQDKTAILLSKIDDGISKALDFASNGMVDNSDEFDGVNEDFEKEMAEAAEEDICAAPQQPTESIRRATLAVVDSRWGVRLKTVHTRSESLQDDAALPESKRRSIEPFNNKFGALKPIASSTITSSSAAKNELLNVFERRKSGFGIGDARRLSVGQAAPAPILGRSRTSTIGGSGLTSGSLMTTTEEVEDC